MSFSLGFNFGGVIVVATTLHGASAGSIGILRINVVPAKQQTIHSVTQLSKQTQKMIVSGVSPYFMNVRGTEEKPKFERSKNKCPRQGTLSCAVHEWQAIILTE